jgi:hypothetical protein
VQKTSEVYEKLYHYTTWDGLLGILQTQSLWATHYKFLNDYSEIVLFRDKLISLILPYVREAYEKLIKKSPQIEQSIKQEGGLGQVVQHDTEVVVDAQYRATGDEIYIVSFCGEHKDPHVNINGLLSQWRGYGTGGGFALVFNTKKLEDILEIEAKSSAYSAMHLSDLIYSNDEKKLKEELSENLSVIADAVKLFFDHENLGRKEDFKTVEKAYHPFISCISRYKHYGFREENEVRVVALPTVLDQGYLELAEKEGVIPQPEKERKFRNKNSQQIPYIELFNSIDIDLPIQQIIVGPHKEKENRAAALRVMLGKTNIEITCSDIPYVG